LNKQKGKPVFLFFLIFFAMAGSISGYISLRILSRFDIGRMWKIAIAFGILFIIFIPPLNILLGRSGIDYNGIRFLIGAGYIGFGFLSFVLTFAVFRDLLWLPLGIIHKMRALVRASALTRKAPDAIDDLSRRGFLVRATSCGIVAAAALSTGVGVVEACRIPEVKEVTVPILHLPRGFEGFRIVQITDLHVNPTFQRPPVQGVVEVVNHLSAHIVVLTGDLVDGSVDQISNKVAPLKRIKSAYGKFFVTGNHEYYSGVLEWIEELKRLGFTVLLNEHRIITRDRDKMLLAGVTDYRGGGDGLPNHRSDPHKALAGSPPSAIKVLLAHQPKSIFEAAHAGYDFQISGHTHGGQFIPWPLLVALSQPYISGLHKHKDTQIYVSRGTGYWGPPVRVGAPSEITLLRLTSAG
jgi:predicted MPP superfamily phosphohydrolase